MSYSDSAEFTIWGKFKSALIANAIFYGIGGVACVAFFLVIFFTTAQREFSQAIGVSMVLTNSWGLLLVVCFVGVGVIIVPRDMWRKSYVDGTLRQNQWKVGLFHEKYKETYDELIAVMKQVRKLDTDIRMTDRFRDFVDAIVFDCPPEYQIIMQGEGDIRYDRKVLVDLHYKLLLAKHNYHCAYTEFHKTVEKALWMEDVSKARAHKTGCEIVWTIPRNTFFRRLPVIGSAIKMCEWLYYVYLKKWVWKVLAIMAYLATIILLWSEVTMFAAFLNKGQFPSLSIYYLLIWKIKSNTPFGIQTIAFISIIYNVWCTYNSLLKLKLFNWYELKKYKLSNTYSLLFSAAYLCRIAIPVVLNMIYLVGFDNTGSAFIRVMGPMSVVPFFGGKFHIAFPALIIIVAGLTLFNCWRSVLSCCKVKQFKFDEFFTADELEKGKEIMRKERDAIIQNKSIEYFGESLNRLNGDLPTTNGQGETFTRGIPLNDIMIDDIIGTAPKKQSDKGFFSFFKKSEENKESIKLAENTKPNKYYNSPKFQLSDSSSSDDESFLYNNKL